MVSRRGVWWPRFAFLCRVAFALCVGSAACAAADDGMVDTALIVSVDVSGSVSAERYRLQMEGIAKALEDPQVLASILSGPRGGILFAMVTWADKPHLVIDWHRIASKSDADAIAASVRKLPHQGGEFTCFAPMFDAVANDIVPTIPVRATRVVLDVSGDGIDNCTDPVDLRLVRQAVLRLHVTINGLPIRVPGENDYVGSGAFRRPGYGLRELSRNPDKEVTTLDRWYETHVIGGAGAFLLPAQGYGDFARALRRKFLIEISGWPPPGTMSRR